VSFAPFSLRSAGIKDFDNDKRYHALRDSMLFTVFPEAHDMEPSEVTDLRKKIGRASRALVRLADGHGDEEMLQFKAAQAEAMGFEVHLGKGVTFSNPVLITRSLDRGERFTPPGQMSVETCRLMLRFAEQLTAFEAIDPDNR
jgi:hypothetical protein